LRTRLKRWLFEGDILRLMGMTLLAKPVGLATQVLVARYFGAGAEYDAYAFVFFLVSFLDNLVGQSYNSVVVPLTIRMRTQLTRLQLMRYQNLVLAIFMVPVAVYMAVLLLRSGWIVGLIAPGLPVETMALPGVAFMFVSMMNAILNLNRRYAVAGAAPLLNSSIILLTVILFHRSCGIWSLPIGYAAANLVQLVVVAVYALRTKCVEAARPAAPAGSLGQLWSIGGLFFLSQLPLTIGMSFERFFSTGLEAGSVSAVSYATTVMNMGGSLFSLSLVVVMFTRMSEYFAAGDVAGCNAYVLDNLNRQVRIVVPASLALCVASDDVVRALFQRGAFDHLAAARTSGALSVYILGLPALVMNSLVSRIFHSLQRMRDKIWLNAQYVLTSLAFCFLLVPGLKVTGLAWAATIAINVHLVLSLWTLHRYRTGLRVGGIAALLARGYAVGALAYGVYRLTGFERLMDGWSLRTSTIGALVVAGFRFAFIMAVFLAGYLAWRGAARRPRRA
jgi:putative peptidoglycan lipid II flippase